MVEAQDTRIINFRRTGDTKFLKNGEEVMKPGDLKPGDHLLIDARQDGESFLYAVNVSFQKEGTPEERAAASEPIQLPVGISSNDDDRPVLRRPDSPAEKAPSADVASTPRKESPAPDEDTAQDKDLDLDHIHESTAKGPLDEEDSGPPRLKRGKPVPRKPPTQVAVNKPPASPVSTRPESAPPPETVSYTPPVADPKIEKARQAAAAFEESLPNYFCQEMMTRFVNDSRVVNWRAQDVVSLEVVYDKKGEHYRNLAINGKPVKKNLQELSGAWSTGEFGTVLMNLFSPSTAAEFRHRKDARSGGRDAYVYDFEVDHEHSHWTVSVPSQSVRPAYRGSVWIDKETGRVLRIEMEARHLPADFPMDKVELATDYEFIRLGEGQFLLPVHAEALGCQRGTDNCSRNSIDFRNYHKYSGETSITFDK
ncbi:MAG: hypothetical protein HYX25_01490 [Candidatus Solibacter usitatus]|nr:hypothetical protein [Candidatus Solibacter usitatus]